MRIIFRSMLIQMRCSLARSVFVFCIIVQPVFYAFLYYFIGKEAMDIQYIGNRMLIGAGITTIWSSILFSSAGDIERERKQGLLEIIWASPSNYYFIYIGKVLGNLLLSMTGFAESILLIYLLRCKIEIEQMGMFTLFFVLTICSFMSLALVIGPIFTLSRNARAFINALEYPIFILCGVATDVDNLPTAIRAMAYLLPPTLGIDSMNECMDGNKINQGSLITRIAIMLAEICILVIFSWKLSAKMDKKIRVKGELGII